MSRFLFGLCLWMGLSINLVASPAVTARGIFVVPGAFVSPEAYEPLVDLVASSLGGDQEIYYASYPANFPRETATAEQLQTFYRSLAERGPKPDITVIAHSQGGLAITSLPEGTYSRIVLMSGYVQNDWIKDPQFPWTTPVLAISGTLDPLTPPDRVAYDAFLFSETHPLKTVLLEDVNHSQFANGENSHTDRESPLSLEDAREKIAKFIAAFIRSEWTSLEADASYQVSQDLIAGYLAQFEKDESACAVAQYRHLGLKAGEAIELKVTSYDHKRQYPKFILDKSSIDLSSDRPLIRIFQFTESRLAPVDVTPLRAVTPEVIACKLRSSAAVSKALGASFVGKSCAEENLALLQESFAKLPLVRQDRLRQRGIDLGSKDLQIETSPQGQRIQGPGFEVNNIARSRGDQWALGSFLGVREDQGRLFVQTYSVTSPVGDPGNLFLGAHYCKLVAPSRAYLWLETLSR